MEENIKMVLIKEDDEFSSKLKATPSYYDVKLKERKAKVIARDKEQRDIFLRSLEYLEKNYPNSNRNLKWGKAKGNFKLDDEKGFKENLEGFNEAELNACWLVIQYSIKEHNYPGMDLLRDYEQILEIISKLIPGGKYLNEEYELKDKIHALERRSIEIRAIREKESKALKVRLSKEVVKDVAKPTEFTCSVCFRKLSTQSALTNHMKTHGD